SPHQAEMAAMALRHHLEDGVRLAVAAGAQDDAVVGPLHDQRFVPPRDSVPAGTCGPALGASIMGKLEPDLAIAFRIVAPVLAHFHEQHQVHFGFDGVRDLAARFAADRLDGLAALAEHDLALAFALHVDRLLDPYRAVLEFL